MDKFENAGGTHVMSSEKTAGQQRVRGLGNQSDDGLGPNTDIGSRLRALYGSVQEEGVPDQLLDLLEKLDSAEAAQKSKSGAQDGQ